MACYLKFQPHYLDIRVFKLRVFNLRDYINARYTNSQSLISSIFLIHGVQATKFKKIVKAHERRLILAFYFQECFLVLWKS